MATRAFADDSRPSSLLARIDRTIALLENALGVTLVITVVIVVLLQVVFRFFLDSPLSWSGEVAIYILVWTTFLGMAIAQRERAHVAMQVLPAMPRVVRRTVDWICWLSVLGMFVVLGWGGLELALLHHVQRSPATGVPIWSIYSALPVGGALGIWHTFRDLPGLVRGEEGTKGWH